MKVHAGQASAAPGQRSVHVWIVIALTLGAAGYYLWQLVGAAMMFTGAGAWGVYPAYVVFALYFLICLAAAIAVYRGYRWIFFFYLLCAVAGGVELFLFLSVYGQKAAALPLERQIAFAVFVPVIQLAIALYGAIVVYLKIYAVNAEEQPS
jgi:hypothetical protein